MPPNDLTELILNDEKLVIKASKKPVKVIRYFEPNKPIEKPEMLNLRDVAPTGANAYLAKQISEGNAGMMDRMNTWAEKESTFAVHFYEIALNESFYQRLRKAITK